MRIGTILFVILALPASVLAETTPEPPRNKTLFFDDYLVAEIDFKQRMKPVLSRVVLRKDGFTAVEAEYKGGQFTTPPSRFQGDALHLNIDTSALGLARVEIQDVAGQPIDGFTLEDCDRIHTANTVDRVVTWRRGQSSVAQVQDQPVRLRFEMRFGVRLYAFQFTPKAK